MAESDEKLKRLLMKVKEESKIGGLNSTFKEKKKKKIMASVPSLHDKEMRKQWKH